MFPRASVRAFTVRRGEVETVAYNRDKGIGVTVYLGQRRGHASTADFSSEAVRAAVDKALAIARFTAEDPAAGLADPARLAHQFPDLDLYDPWPLAVDDAVALGREAEAAALAVDRRLTNTEGATVAWNESEFVYANSNGFSGGYRSTRHHIDCAVIGEPDDGGVMQRDYWYTAGPRRHRISNRLPKSDAWPANARPGASTRASYRHPRVPGRCSKRRKLPTSLGRLSRPVSGGSALSEVHVPARFASARQVFAPHMSQLREEPAFEARPRQRAVRRRRCGDRRPGTSS